MSPPSKLQQNGGAKHQSNQDKFWPEAQYMVDAKLKGNVARFINHSSSDPNLFPQMVFCAGCVPTTLRSYRSSPFELHARVISCHGGSHDCVSVGFMRSHIDPQMPAIALFANQDIKPFTELFFDVSYRHRPCLANAFVPLYCCCRRCPSDECNHACTVRTAARGCIEQRLAAASYLN